MTEQEVIEQLSNYKRLVARKQVLETYPVGAGITVSRLNQDDQLQELHQKLRGMPSYMYLSKREQDLETVAHTYLGGKYPSGIKHQRLAVPVTGLDDEDTKLLKELKGKIKKVLAARGYGRDGRNDIDAVLDRLAEYQDLQEEILRIDMVLTALEQYKPEYATILRMRYINETDVEVTCKALSVAEATYYRWRTKAFHEYIRLCS